MPDANVATRRLFVTSAFAVSLLAMVPLTQAATPWGMIAGRVIGRVEKLSQPPKDDQAGFDVATVVLNADAAKVYATTVGMLRKNQQVHVTTEDSRASHG